MVERLICVRHAESKLSAAGLVSGDPAADCPLTDRGREQAAHLREVVGAVDICVVTQFPRTHETADIALAGTEIPRIVEPALNDPPVGGFEGRPVTEYLDWLRSNDWTKAPDGGGMSQLQSIERFLGGFERVLARAEGSVLVVAHSFPLSVACTLAREEPPLVRREYAGPVEHATPIAIDPAALARGVTRARRELDEIFQA